MASESVIDDRLRVDDLRALIRDAADYAMPGSANVAVASVPPGAGKTRQVLEEITTIRVGTLLAASHRALDEREQEAEEHGLDSRRRARGLLAVLDDDGRPICRHANKLRPWAAQGLKLRTLVCDYCPDQLNYAGSGEECRAYAYDAGCGPTFGTYAHAQILGPKNDLPAVIFADELPPLVRTTHVSTAELATVGVVHDHVVNQWCEPRAPLARIVLDAAKRQIEADARQPSAYTQRIHGAELRRLLVESARGPEVLDAAIATLQQAHATAPKPPIHGKEILVGVTPDSRPRLDLDTVLLALAHEGHASRDGETACLAVGYVRDDDDDDDRPLRRGAWVEHRSRGLDRWTDGDGRPLPMVILDATAPLMMSAIRAALPSSKVRLYNLSIPEIAGAVRRVHVPSYGLTRSRLFGRGRRYKLTDDGDSALAGVLLRTAAEAWGGTGGIVTHKPLALLLRACLPFLSQPTGTDPAEAALVEARNCPCTLSALRELHERVVLAPERLLWFGGQRGSNALVACRLVAVIGDPWPEIGAAFEDARTLKIGKDRYVTALRDAEVAQALGRAREIRRTLDNPVTLVAAGRDPPACWEHVQSVDLPHREGGPTPSLASMLAERVARDMLERWGIASAALARLCADAPIVAETLDIARQLRARDEDNRSCRAITAEDLTRIARLPARTLQDAFRRALHGIEVAPVSNPTGRPGRWQLYARSPEDLARGVEAILRGLQRR